MSKHKYKNTHLRYCCVPFHPSIYPHCNIGMFAPLQQRCACATAAGAAGGLPPRLPGAGALAEAGRGR